VRIHQFLVAVDQVLNTFTSDGWADETLSAHAWRSRGKSPAWRRARKVIDGIFFWEKDHCQMAYESEMLRMQAPPEYRSLI